MGDLRNGWRRQDMMQSLCIDGCSVDGGKRGESPRVVGRYMV
jgi:hypothetical protein